MILQDTLKLKQADGYKLPGQKQDTSVRKNSDTLTNILQGDTVKKTSIKISGASITKSNTGIDASLKKLSTEFSNKKTADIINYYISDISTTSSEQTNIIFPYTFIEPSAKIRNELLTRISSVTKEGIRIEKNNLKSDWMLPVILFSLLVYLIMSRVFPDFMKLLKKFITLRTTGEPVAPNIFKFSSALFDLTSYVIISLFIYSAFIFFNISTAGIKDYFLFLIILASIIFLSFARHSVTFLTGEISEQKDIFTEYGRVITSFYRSAGLILFFILVTLLYTNFFSQETIFYTGFSALILLYTIRIINLFLIFIRRNASFLYLIFYLCALEILPVAVIIKFIMQLLQNIK